MLFDNAKQVPLHAGQKAPPNFAGVRVKKGSVKTLFIEKEATEKEFGLGVFEFTDDYSVFDYGKMPDTIDGKGEALCRLSFYNLKEIEKLGIKTHLRKAMFPKKIEVNLVRVLFPQKGEIHENEKNYLVPLEVIFRNSLPAGSSVFKRLEIREISPKDIGLDKMPKPGEKLKKPVLDVSTKLEETDRYLNWQEAKELAKISDKQLEELKQKTLKINDFLTKKAKKIGLEHADGKAEFAINPKGELMLVDTCGTLDENRLLFEGVHLSKQVLRDYYKTTPWYAELEAAKAARKPKNAWPKPQKAPKELIQIVSNMYKSVCEAWTGQKAWNAPKIKEVVKEYKEFLKKPNR